MKLRSILCVAFAITSYAGTASALEEFPRDIEKTLALKYEPPCRLCHVQNITGAGTLQTSFAMSMRARGLNADDRASLPIALEKMRTDKVDSDGDGVLDVDELVAGTDPTSSAPGARLDEGAIGGCSWNRRGGGEGAIVAALAVLFARRRRR